MKKLFLIVGIVFTIGCGVEKHREEIIIPPASVTQFDTTSVPNCTVLRNALDTNRNGKWDLSDKEQQQSMVCSGAAGQDGTSCTVAPEMSGSVQVGARISCSDNSWTVILNGEKGDQGDRGEDGAACTAQTVPALPLLAPTGGIAITCPGQSPKLLENGASIGLKTTNNPVACGAEGGKQLTFFKDNNSNGTLDTLFSVPIEPTVSQFVVCNGKRGLDGQNGQSSSVTMETLAAGGVCPAGGIKLTTTNGNVTEVKNVCNGQNGSDGQNGQSAYDIAVNNGFQGDEQDWLNSLKGATGQAGPAGAPGQNGKSAYEVWLTLPGNSGKSEADFIQDITGDPGAPGAVGPAGPPSLGSSSIIPLCPGDIANAEYGIISGGQLYAVYNDRNNNFSFLAKLVPGTTYQTTNVANQSTACTFKYTNNGQNITLTNSTSTMVYSLNSGSTGMVTTGDCSFKKTQDNNGSQHYRFKLENSVGLLGDYQVQVQTDGTASSVGTNNNGNFSGSSPNFIFDPINNGQNQFEVYVHSSAQVQLKTDKAFVVKKSNTSVKIQCSVDNSL